MDDDDVPGGGGGAQLRSKPLPLDGRAAGPIGLIAGLSEAVHDKEVHRSGDEIIVALIIRRAGISIPRQVEVIEIRAGQVFGCFACIVVIVIAQGRKEPVDRSLTYRTGCARRRNVLQEAAVIFSDGEIESLCTRASCSQVIIIAQCKDQVRVPAAHHAGYGRFVLVVHTVIAKGRKCERAGLRARLGSREDQERKDQRPCQDNGKSAFHNHLRCSGT